MKHPFKLFFAGFFTALAAIGCLIILSSFSTKGDLLKTTFNSISTAISWNEAIAMRNNYKEMQPLRIGISENGSMREVPLEGFTIDANQLQEIISNNKSGGSADAVMFYLGAENPLSGSTLPRYNLIAVGLKNGVLMIPNNREEWDNPTKSSVFDKAEPCPPFCPE